MMILMDIEFDRAHEDHKLLKRAIQMSLKDTTVGVCELPYITIKEALQFIGAYDAK